MSIALIGYLTFLAACTAVGVRLFAAGIRSGELPELALGAGFLCSGGIGFLFMLMPALLPGMDERALFMAGVTGQVVSNLGFIGLYLFNTVVFAGGRRSAIATSVAGCAILAVAVVGGASAGVDSFLRVDSPWYWCNFVGRSGSFLWSAWAGLHYHGLHRKRIALGIGDPVVANRFLLWGLFGVFAVGLSILGALGATLGDPGNPPLPIALAVSALGVACAGSMWLAFFPPAAYLRRVSDRAATPA